IRHVDPSPVARHIALVKTWIDEGFDPVETILPAVQEAVATATERISSLQYFDRSIRQFHARKEAQTNGFSTRSRNGKSSSGHGITVDAALAFIADGGP
ncbi:hypothetical protein, partial [Bacillus thuringiensis]|uniref:hypothetical protein n=1 Tax=Bacillus thuringiensis TaxID=1428 RepID=UPI0021761364